METQLKMILHHLKIRPLTPMEALVHIGCFRLAARIFDLRKAGYVIDMKMIEEEETGARYAEYTLISEP